MGEGTVVPLDVPPGRRLRAPARRAQLLEVADRAVAEHGAAISMDEIARQANVTKAVLYRHFASKADLYAALAERGADQVISAVRAALELDVPARQRVAAAIDAYLAHIEARAEGYRLLSRAAQSDAVEAAQVIHAVSERLADELAAGFSSELQPPAAAALAITWSRAIIGAVVAAGDSWLDRGHVTRRELVDQLVSFFWGDLGALLDAAP